MCLGHDFEQRRAVFAMESGWKGSEDFSAQDCFNGWECGLGKGGVYSVPEERCSPKTAATWDPTLITVTTRLRCVRQARVSEHTSLPAGTRRNILRFEIDVDSQRLHETLRW